MTFREAVLSQMPKEKAAKLEAKRGPIRRALWALAERRARIAIEEETGEKLVGKVDWSKWIDLLVKLMPIFMAIFGL